MGCGLIGQRRARALGRARLVACADKELGRAQALAQSHPNAVALGSWEEAITFPGVDIVVVATTNDALARISEAAVAAGRHVLVEKPAARSTAELQTVVQAAARTGALVRVGFNHRYHPALRKAMEIWSAGGVGEPMFVRGRYGHGGRVGYEREWRADPALSGGGELMDQGVHLIDLARWFLGEFVDVRGFAQTFFWDMPVDDNAFILGRTKERRAATLHVSCTEWKNLFSLELYGRTGKLHVEGLGGSYGVERVAYHRMLPQMGPPETTIWEFPRGDDSWALEFAEFLDDIERRREPSAGLKDAMAALTVVERIYRESGEPGAGF